MVPIASAIALVVFFASGMQYSRLSVKRYEFASPRVPSSFDGFKIVQLTDLHGASFGEDNDDLFALIEEENPDIIAITGDWFDEYKGSPETALSLTARITGLAPVYYVTGNHELATPRYKDHLETMRGLGVRVLSDESARITREPSSISLVGVNDSLLKKRSGYFRDLERLSSENNDFKILLAHRPEYIDKYFELGYDLTLSGHTHGGQVRMPLIGALAAPNQRPLPEHSYGMYDLDHKAMIVSAGLGVSRAFPYRVFTPPEVVVITLKRSQPS